METTEGKLPPDERLRLFKGVVENLMHDASKVLAELELEVNGPEAERLMSLLDQYLSYTERLCKGESRRPGCDEHSINWESSQKGRFVFHILFSSVKPAFIRPDPRMELTR